MKRYTLLYILSLVVPSLFMACVDDEEYADSPEGNFEALWHIIDEHYCYFSYKNQQYGLDWDDVYSKYKPRVSSNLNRDQLFEICADMLAELRDGHVNLSSSYDMARYWSWHEDFPANFSDTLQRRYLGTDYKIAAGLKYRILDDNIGYIYYSSFNNGIGEGNLDEVIMELMLCRGLIIDIRNNGGGYLNYAERFASRFFHSPTLVGYLQHKTGKGHNDFSAKEEQWIEPSANLRWHKPVCILTNRSVYSAANEFVKYMSVLPNVTIVGDKTGGGGGMPMSSQLPNGWIVRYSAVPSYDSQGRDIEFGIDPDLPAAITDADFSRGFDTIIEAARTYLNK
ncbi:MAG: S41 family peptidase [Prevotellaceae bacterium]|nr:S41 family peptidase [Prevotellaceae bacterium]